MNRERAEAHLRLPAEEELRRATPRVPDGTGGANWLVAKAAGEGNFEIFPELRLASHAGEAAAQPSVQAAEHPFGVREPK